jgi:hypothetical protein
VEFDRDLFRVTKAGIVPLRVPKTRRARPASRGANNRCATEADRDQRIAIELINLPFLRTGASADEYRAGIERAIENGWLVRHESGTFVKFTQAGADLFA